MKSRIPDKTLLVLLGVWFIFTVSPFQASEQEGPSELPLRMILVRSRSEAEQVLGRIKAGDSFEVLARRHSIHRTAAEGGYIGEMKLSGARPEIRDALQGVGPGEVTGVVQTAAGYMILQVLPESGRDRMEGRESSRVPSARANYQVVRQVSGWKVYRHFFRRLEKPADYDQDLQAMCEAQLQAPRLGIQQLKSRLDELQVQDPQQHDFDEVWQTHHVLALLLSFVGNMEEALEHFESAYRIVVAHGVKVAELDLEEKLGIAHLYRGEVENRVNHRAQSSIFPLRPQARHQLASGSENAIRHFRKYLDQQPDDLEVKWLLNLAYMTLGQYPQDVPAEHLIAPAVFESREDIGQFVDVAPSLGVDRFSMAGGAILDDFDNDGCLDVVFSSRDACAPMRYFHNNGDGTFGDQSSPSGLSKQLGGTNILQVDYNNDGGLDIYVMRGAYEVPMRNSLLRNNGDGTFSDVTHASGLALPATQNHTAAWADFDNDGHIDLFVGNERGRSQLFQNHGDGTFTNVAAAAGVDRTAFTKGVVAGDYDNDGYPDFYVSNLRGENFLYHNNRDGTFTDVARQLGVEKPFVSFPVWFFDYDNDGGLDLFVSSFVPSLVEVARGYLGLPTRAETLKLYRNTGAGSFQDVTKQVGLERAFMPMGSNFGDADNDGFLDFYLGTGSPSYASLVPNVLFRNREGRDFVDITTSSGMGHLQKGHGVAFGDFDNDGDQDVLQQMGGGVPGDRYGNALFRNPGQGNNWIRVQLVGVKTNRAALGARIKVGVENRDNTRRFIYRQVSSGGSFGASPLQQHIGLGKAERIDTLEIWWPTSNQRQVFHNVSPNQFIQIKEFEESFVQRQCHAP